jgi:HAE1 family hydrophobic/amphiphilic exporter-1
MTNHTAKNGQKVYSVIGGFGGSEVNTANLFVTLKSEGRKHAQKDVEDELRKNFKSLVDLSMQVRIQGGGGASFGGRRGYPIELNLKGSNWMKLVDNAKSFQEALSKDSHFTDVDSSYEEGSPEFHVIPRRQSANDHGVSMDVLSQTLQVLYQGMKAGKFNDEGRRSDIVVQADPSKAPQNLNDLGKLFIRNNRGNLVSLNQLVKIEQKTTAATITRENRERKIGVYSNVATGVSHEKAIERAMEIGKQLLPSDIVLEATGSSQEMKKTFTSLIFALLVGIFVAYMVLASQYNSYVHPVTILLALPLSITGAWLALYLGGSSINIYSLIGLLLLMGLVKKNSIMLVEFSNELRRESQMNVDTAIIEAGKVRLRPILMTSFSTIAAAIPPALSLGHSSSSSKPMALVILGGVLFSTFLTLLVVPVVYRHFVPLENKLDPT